MWELCGKQGKEIREHEIAEMSWELDVRIGEGKQREKEKTGSLRKLRIRKQNDFRQEIVLDTGNAKRKRQALLWKKSNSPDSDTNINRMACVTVEAFTGCRNQHGR